MQPIIRGIQAVGAVDIYYKYNGGILYPPADSIRILDGDGNPVTSGIDTSEGIALAGFRLDGEFLRANPQITSSVVIPILGGGGVALTNNNRTGTLSINCTKVSTPSSGTHPVIKDGEGAETENKDVTENLGAMLSSGGIGPLNGAVVYDMTLIAQIQQAQTGGDDVGATICIVFKFNGMKTKVQFEGCTIATVDPVALTGNDAASYNVAINYLNWRVDFNGSEGNFIV